jgi:hypothetical protein
MKALFSITLISFLFFACQPKDSENVREELQTVQDTISNSDSTINAMLAAFNDIQENLLEIKIREGKIQIGSAEIDKNNPQEQIIADIQMLNNLMMENEAKLIKLNKSLEQSRGKNSEFRRLVLNLNKQLEEKNKEIYSLNENLKLKQLEMEGLYFKLDSSGYENSSLEKELDSKENELNKAFYTYGTSKELIEKNVISKEGGFLGLGKSKSLKNQFNDDYFTEIDVSKQKSFLIYAEKAELITTHPATSYKLMGSDNKVDSLLITNPEEFWKASKYLVIVID